MHLLEVQVGVKGGLESKPFNKRHHCPRAKVLATPRTLSLDEGEEEEVREGEPEISAWGDFAEKAHRHIKPTLPLIPAIVISKATYLDIFM